MKINNKFKKVYITIFMLFILYTDNTIALTGSEIIKRANQYLTLRWQCNPWNAYEVIDSKGNILKSNRDPDPNNDINEYPFYPQGACYLDENNIPRISNGLYIGMAYAWGLRESPKVFIEKLRKINYNGTGYMAGNHVKTYKKKSEENLRWRLWYYYTGIDCSGLVWNSMGFPKLSRPSSPYSLCRFNTTNIMDQSGIFSGISIISSTVPLSFITSMRLFTLSLTYIFSLPISISSLTTTGYPSLAPLNSK